MSGPLKPQVSAAQSYLNYALQRAQIESEPGQVIQIPAPQPPSRWQRFSAAVRRFFARAASLTRKAAEIAQEVIPHLVAAGLAAPGLSDAERRARAKAAISAYMKKHYPSVPEALFDIVVGLVFDSLLSMSRKATR